MGLLIGIAEAATAVSVVLLAVLAVIWARNYRRFRSKHTLGLTVFAVLLLAENGIGLYYYVLDPTMTGWWRTIETQHTVAMQAMLLLDVIELAALLFLAWVTWD